MEPTINIKDIVVVKKCDVNQLKENDIITFKNVEKIISHRIKKKNIDENGISFTTKGDNNSKEDNFKVFPEQIYGKVIFKIKGLGNMIKYIQNINGFINIIIILIIIFIVINMRDKQKCIRKNKRRKYEIKKKRDNYKI